MREGKIEKHLCNLVAKAGGRAYKWVSPGNRGVPDRLVILGGMVFFVETKATEGKLSAVQTVQHRELRKLGVEPIVINSKESAEEWVAMQSQALKPHMLTIEDIDFMLPYSLPDGVSIDEIP